MRYAGWMTLVAAPLLLGPASVATGAAPTGFCRAGETTLFACTAGAKRIAVCARGGFVQYRYGAPGKLELAYPARAGAGQLDRVQVPYSGGGEAQIGFDRGGLRYVVFSRMIRTGFGPEGNRPVFESGVMVLQEGKKLSDRRCTRPDDAEIDMDQAERLLPEGDLATVDE